MDWSKTIHVMDSIDVNPNGAMSGIFRSFVQ